MISDGQSERLKVLVDMLNTIMGSLIELMTEDKEKADLCSIDVNHLSRVREKIRKWEFLESMYPDAVDHVRLFTLREIKVIEEALKATVNTLEE